MNKTLHRLNRINKHIEKFAIEAPNVNVFGYHTRHFDVCPKAQALFEHIITMPLEEEYKGMVRSAAQSVDNLFRVKSEVLEKGKATQHEYEEAALLADDFKDIMREVDEEVGMVHDTSFVDNHIEEIKPLVDGNE